MNFWTIFLCLLFGAIVGFEFGRHLVAKRFQEALGKLSDEMKKAAEDIQKKKEQEEVLKQERQANLMRLMTEILPKMDPKDFREKMGIQEKDILEIKETETDGKGA